MTRTLLSTLLLITCFSASISFGMEAFEGSADEKKIHKLPSKEAIAMAIMEEFTRLQVNEAFSTIEDYLYERKKIDPTTNNEEVIKLKESLNKLTICFKDTTVNSIVQKIIQSKETDNNHIISKSLSEISSSLEYIDFSHAEIKVLTDHIKKLFKTYIESIKPTLEEEYPTLKNN